MNRGRGNGFSLLELVVAIAILSVVALGLIAMLASSQQYGSLTRERQCAQAALRAYVEYLRSLTLANATTDTKTPADFVDLNGSFALSASQGPGLGNYKAVPPVGEVWKLMDESGANAWYLSGTQGSANATTSISTFAATSARLGAPFDMNGNGLTTDTFTDGTTLIYLPIYAKLSWQSLLVGNAGSLGTGTNAYMDTYACIGQPQ